MNAAHYFTVLAQTEWWEWWPVAVVLGVLIFFAWWNEHYTRD